MPELPPLDPEIAEALVAQRISPSLRPDEIAPLRALSVAPEDVIPELEATFVHTVHTVPVAGAEPTWIVLLTPRDAVAPAPLLFHIHGGGLVVGTPYDGLEQTAALAAEVGMAVASVEYRLAPEHPYPAAIDDISAALEWTLAQAETLGLDRERVVVEGVSAGGGLAAAAVLRARARGLDGLLGQMLICPMLDDRNSSGSAVQMAGAGAWDREANETGWSAYLGAARDEACEFASPARATDLGGLPRTFIDVGSAETFRDECVDYAARIWAAGGDAELHVWPGGAHGFDALAPQAMLTADAIEARRRWLERMLAQGRLA